MCKTLLVGGLSVKILVMAAFYWESMKISGEGYLDLLNQSRRGAHWVDFFGASREAPKYPQDPMWKKKFVFERGVQTSHNA